MNKAIGSMTERGYNMHTYTGHRVYPLDLKEEDIQLLTIAHSLSLQNRYLGHTKFPYSVAQHSIYMSHVVPAEYAFEALMHDAAEAYCGDLIRPIKYSPELVSFREIEDRIDYIIRNKFRLPPKMSAVIKDADTRMAFTEKRDILVPSDADWGVPSIPYEEPIREKNWMDVKAEFIERFAELAV